MINHNKALTLITDLHDAGIINAEELKKAELYLSPSSKGINNRRDAVEWLIHNRAVSRERQERVRELAAALERRHSTQASAAKLQETQIAPTVAAQQPQKPLVESEYIDRQTETVRTSAETRLDSAVAAEIFELNKARLRQLVGLSVVKPGDQKKIEEKLKDCYYVFYDFGSLQEWVESGCPDRSIDKLTALQLYSLTKQNIIDEEDYRYGYEKLWSVGNNQSAHLTFKDETELFHWLAENGCFYHDITDPQQAKTYRENLESLEKLDDQNLFDPNAFGQIAIALAGETRRFTEETLLEWIKQNNLAKVQPQPKAAKGKKPKRRRPPLLFMIFFIYVLYRIFSNAFEDDTLAKPVERPSAPAVTTQNRINTSAANIIDREEVIANILRQHATIDDRVKPLGNLVQIEDRIQISPNAYRVNGIFEKGTALITFRVVSDTDNRQITLSRITYSEIQPQQNAPVNPAANAAAAPKSLEKYEQIVMDNLRQVDRFMAERQPNTIKLLDIIQKAELTGRCTTGKNNVTLCPFTIYYKDVWLNKDTIRNYQMNVRFVEQNGDVKLQSQVEFIKDLTDKMYNDYQR